MNALETCGVSFAYPNSQSLFSQLNIHVQLGECVVLEGSSGSGKTTLCHILAGIIPRSVAGDLSGDIFVFGTHMQSLSLASLVQKVGILFQNPEAQLFFPTVEDEIAFGPENLCFSRSEIALRIEKALEMVGMNSYRYAKTETLSFGQKQLIAFAAVLALEPDILLLDEVFASLDSSSTEIVREIIAQQKKLGKAILMVENSGEHSGLVDRIYRLEAGSVKEVQS